MTSATLEIMHRTVRKAARAIIRDFGEVENLQVSRKGPADFVSIADKKSESIIKDALAHARPNSAFVCEESGLSGTRDTEHIFIVDPLDGTSNFLHAIPHFAISIAYLYRGEIVMGVVYDPIKDEMFSAEKGGGAYMNDSRIRVSGRFDLSECLVATGTPFKGVSEDKINMYKGCLTGVMENTAGVRRLGSAALDLAYVAMGRYDAYFEYGGCVWDIAAGLIIVQESGGLIVNEKNQSYKLQDMEEQTQWILATNNMVKQDMYRIIFL